MFAIQNGLSGSIKKSAGELSVLKYPKLRFHIIGFNMKTVLGSHLPEWIHTSDVLKYWLA